MTLFSCDYNCFAYWILICLASFWLPTTMVRVSEKCCVPNCGKTRLDNVILHKFPNPANEPDRFRTWLYAFGGDILALENQRIHDYRKVCHIHFDKSHITWSGRLSAIAVPTLYLKGLATQRESMEIENNLQQPSTSQGLPAQRVPLMEITQRHMNVVTDLPPQPSTSQDFGQPRNVCNKTSTGMKKTPIVSKGSKSIYTARFCTEASTLVKHIKKLQKTKDTYAVKLKKALSLSSNQTFQKALGKFTTTAFIFIMMQFREANKNKMGRRFKKQEKIMALSLYKQGPKAYRWLRHIFVLPSPLTLSRMISTASLKAGLNDNIFDYLKKKARKMSLTDRLCILLFDEMSIAPHFQYNSKKDLIIGFVDSGKERTMKIADHALVFMIRGISKNYKQPISYSFCSGSTGKIQLAEAIQNHIKKLKLSGFEVVATVCDQGASNMSAINSLIESTKAKYLKNNLDFKNNVFEVDGKEIIPLYDPPHLIKGIRNNLITKNLTCEINKEKKTAQWNHITKLYEENPAYKGIRLLPKLTEQHVNPKKMMKMKVKFATQLLSRSVAVNMGYLADKGILDASSKETADIILFFDELFDSVNGGFMNEKKRPGKELLGALTPTSCHQSVWTKSKAVLKTMKFITPQGKASNVPSVSNWLRTLENLEYLKEQLFQSHNLKSLWLRHFNQDPLENFFGCVRSHGIRNNNPTCEHFEVAFASLLINNMNSIHSPGSNCERDNGRTFKSLNKIFFVNPVILDCAPTEVNFDHISDHILVGISKKKNNLKIMAQIEYVTGYILRKSRKIFKNCESCNSCLYDSSTGSEYINVKEYREGKKYLSYPADRLVECFSNIQDVVTNILKSDSDMVNIKHYIKTVLCIVLDFNFINCINHKDALTNHIIDLSCKFFLNNWCRVTNKLLKGLRQDFDSQDKLQEMAKYILLETKKIK